MKRHLPCCVAATFCCLVSVATAMDGYTTALFDGKTLDGWHVTGCEADVEDGAIVIREGNGLLRTNARYTDFVLELDWKALKPDQWDSGIYFRCKLPPPSGRPWPKRYQVNLRKGLEGNVEGLEGASSEGLCKPREWNHFKFTVRGTSAALEINGQPAWEADGLESPSGFICLQAEVPGGGRFLFRNVTLTELNHKSLFDGKSLAGWQETGKGECWKVENGLLMCTGKPGSWLRSTEEHGDFNLRLEYKLKPGGNSGVYARVPEDGNHHGQDSGVEIQILDDEHPRYAKLKPYQFSGSVYAIVAGEPRAGRPVGEWNHLEINCRGTDYRVTLNGTVVVDAKAAEFAELARRRTTGYLGFQNHSEEVYFRNLRIGPPRE